MKKDCVELCCLLLDQDSALQSPQDRGTNLNSRRTTKKRSSSTCTRSPPSGLGKVDAYSSLHFIICHYISLHVITIQYISLVYKVQDPIVDLDGQS